MGLLSDGSFYDPAKLAAALAAQQPGADGRTVLGDQGWMSILNPLSGLSLYQAASAGGANTNYGDGGGDQYAPAQAAVYKDGQGRTYTSAGTDAQGNQLITYTDNNGEGWKNPTGSGHDFVRPTYKLDAQGNATPVSAGSSYQAGDWVNNGRDVAKYLGSVLAAGAGGAYLGAGDAAASGAAGAEGGGMANLGGFAGGAGGDATLGAEGLATAAPAYGGVGTAGAGAATDAATTLGAGGMGTGTLGTSAAGVAGSSLIPGISNGQLLTTGAGLLGAAAGSKGGLNSATNTTQNQIDPRMAPYLYGANGNGGLLNSVNNLTNAQLATGGLNANQSAGLQMQLNALNDPAYSAGLTQMRNAGQGLLSAPQAPNPFTSGGGGAFAPQAGQAPAIGQAPQGGPGWQPMQTQLSRPGMSTGLLGNLRPYGQ